MPGLIISGREVAIPTVTVANFKDDPKLRLLLGEDGKRRQPPKGAKRPRVSSLTFHTTRGIPGGSDKRAQQVLKGAGPSTNAGRRVVDMWTRDERYAGAHLIIDFDRTVYCIADIVDEESFHATTANHVSVGIEIVQGGQAELYEEQIHTALVVANFLTATLGIQRQIPCKYRRRPHKRLEEGALDWWGVFGHRDQTYNRGEGDPGNYLMDCLATIGYERFDLDAGEDLKAWKARQEWLGFEPKDRDGIPGPATVAALRKAGYVDGLWACPPVERADTIT